MCPNQLFPTVGCDGELDIAVRDWTIFSKYQLENKRVDKVIEAVSCIN
jgi:hypothetical protein